MLTGKKPNIEIKPLTFNTIGDHILQRRRELNLFQKDVARILNVDRATIINWETKPWIPRVHLMPALIEFLGYVPYRVPKSFGRWLAQCRMTEGKTRKELAQILGFDEETVGNWETD